MGLLNGKDFLYGIAKNIETEIDDIFEEIIRTPIKIIGLYFLLLLLLLIALFSIVFVAVFAVDLALSIV